MSKSIQKFDPLSPFIRLTPSIYLAEPSIQSKDKKKPSTIVLSFWSSAPPRAAVKYVLKYQELLPSARIVFIFNGPQDFYLYPTVESHRLRFKPAVDILAGSQAEASPESGDDGSTYIHLFSNGGVYSTALLLLTYKAITGKPLRVSSMLLDSAPGRPTPALSIKALSYALPQTVVVRQVGLAILALTIWLPYLTKKSMQLVRNLFWEKPSKDSDIVVYGDDPLAFSRKALLDDNVIVARTPKDSIKMCYIYSELDDLVPWKDVKEHAALASSVKGRRDVQLERFSDSPHVGHMRVEPERYWSIVERYLV